MARNLKTLGLVLVAILAMVALTAPAAAAGDNLITSPNYETAVLTGTSHDNVFKITSTATSVECTTTKVSATAESNAEEVKVFPTYSGKLNATPHSTDCTTTIGEATIDTTGCNFKLTGATTGGVAPISIECEAGKEIKITDTTGCTIKIPSQTPTSGGVTYKNEEEGGKRVVKATTAITGITYSTNFVCQVGGIPAEGDDADYNGTMVLKGYEDKGGPTNGDEFTEGEQFGIEVIQGAKGDQLITSPNYETAVLTGTSHDNVFKITSTATSVECTTTKVSATAESNAEEVKVFPTYSGKLNATPHSTNCTTSFGGEGATIDTTGCNFKLTGATTGGVAPVSIECEAGKEIKITDASGCTIKIPSQTPTSGGVTYKNEEEGGKRVVKATTAITGITYSTNFVCQVGGIPAEGDDADYNGTMVLKGYEDKGGPTNGDEFTEGEQFGIEVIQGAKGDQLITSPNYETAVLTGTSHDNVFKITSTATSVECTTTKVSATAENNAEEAKVFPTYSGKLNATPHGTNCTTSFGGEGATIDTTGCNFKLTGATTGGVAPVSIECEAGKEIKITDASGCTIKIPSQTPTSGGVTYKNEEEGGKRVVKATTAITGITYSTNFVCQVGGIPAEGDDADYNGTMVLKGYEDKGGPTNGDEFTEGEQFGIEVI